MEFTQKAFLKRYIKRDTDLPKEAEKESNKIKKQNAQLRNNAVFIKSIESSMNRTGVNIEIT